MQSAVDRRQSLLELMCERRHETIDNLAFEFNVDMQGCPPTTKNRKAAMTRRSNTLSN